jgi:hypothetical protein
MKYAVEMGSYAMIYIYIYIYTYKLNFIQISLIGGSSQTHRQHGDLISVLLFFSK